MSGVISAISPASTRGSTSSFHVSHVGACTGRDHFSGWGLEWINVGLSYLPYLHRFYGPADARAAFLAVCDMAAHYGGHIIGIPRDSLPILEKQDGSGPLWEAGDAWEPVTVYRTYAGAERARSWLLVRRLFWLARRLNNSKGGVDVHIINGLPLPDAALEELSGPLSQGRGNYRRWPNRRGQRRKCAVLLGWWRASLATWAFRRRTSALPIRRRPRQKAI